METLSIKTSRGLDVFGIFKSFQKLLQVREALSTFVSRKCICWMSLHTVTFLIMTSTSDLPERIATCADAVRFLLRGQDEHDSFYKCYKKVMKLLPPGKATEYRNTNMVKASLEYLRQGFADPHTPDRKVSIALYVSIYIGHDHDEDDGVLAKEFCKRFQVLANYDANVMTKIFNLSLRNDRILALLDATVAPGRKKKGTFALIMHEFRVEFVLLYFKVVESLVLREQSLTDLGYPADLTAVDVEAAHKTLDKYVSSIADKYWPCFNMDALKKPRVLNNLFPHGGRLPRVVIGREHIDFHLATTGTLRNSLEDKAGKDEFMEMMRAIICLSTRGPVATFRDFKFESVKKFFMDSILDTSHVDGVLEAMSETVDHADLRAELESSKEENSALKEKNLALKEELESFSPLEERYRSVLKTLSTKDEKMDEYELENRRLKLNEIGFKSAESYCKEYHVDKKRRSRWPDRIDKEWLLQQRFDDGHP